MKIIVDKPLVEPKYSYLINQNLAKQRDMARMCERRRIRLSKRDYAYAA